MLAAPAVGNLSGSDPPPGFTSIVEPSLVPYCGCQRPFVDKTQKLANQQRIIQTNSIVSVNTEISIVRKTGQIGKGGAHSSEDRGNGTN